MSSYVPRAPDVAVTLLAELDDRHVTADALARVHERAVLDGYELRQTEPQDEYLAAWIDATFPGSTWSSEAYAGNAWTAVRAGTIVGFMAFDKPMDRHCTWLRAWRDRSDVGLVGPIGVVASERGTGLGAILVTAVLASLRARGYTQALFPAADGERFITLITHLSGARVVDSFPRAFRRRHRATILASGTGTNARNVMQRVAAGALPIEIGALIANQADAGALAAAREHSVPAIALPWDRATESRAAYDARLIEAVAGTAPDVVLLLGWMHLLAPAFLSRFGATLNVHPAFLPLDPRADTLAAPDGTRIPALRGAHALRDALRDGVPWVGATFHHVTTQTDRGEVLVRIPVAVNGTARTEEALRDRVRPAEFAAVENGIRRWAGPLEEGI